MNHLSEVLMTPLGVGLRLGALLLVICQLWLLLRALTQKQRPAVLVLFGLHTLLGLTVLTLLLDGAYRLEYLPYERAYSAAVLWLGSLPWGLIAGAEAASVLLCVLGTRQVITYARSYPNAQAVKQTVDLLPTGLCVAGEDGLILLSNLKMNACNLALTGSVYSDANTLWAAAQACGEPQDGKLLARLKDGSVLLMERTALLLAGRSLIQITAEDVTEQYRMTAELTEKNVRLQELQKRLKDYRERQKTLVIRQELLSARTAIHNQLGGALLTGKYHLEHPESADAETLRLLLRHINTCLLSEAELPDADTDPIEAALEAAEGFGVRVELTGDVPGPGPLRTLLGQAIAECAANTVKHAGGDLLEAQVDGQSFTITNNGKPPAGEIRPAGGLRSLRLAVEQAGGTLTVESSPRFRLHVVAGDWASGFSENRQTSDGQHGGLSGILDT